MKTLITRIKLMINALITIFAYSARVASANRLIGDAVYDESVYAGDITDGIEFDGDAENVSPEEMSSLVGAPSGSLAKLMATKKMSKTRVPANRPNAKAAAAASIMAQMQVPGNALKLASLPPVFGDNFSIQSQALRGRVSGDEFADRVRVFRADYPVNHLSLSQTGVPAGNDFVFNFAGVGSVNRGVPCVFIIISSSTQNATVGSEIGVSFSAGKTEKGHAISTRETKIKRSDSSKSMVVVMLPVVEINDIIRAALAEVTSVNSCSIHITGCATTDIINVDIPGVDYIPFKELMGKVGIPY